MTKTQKIICPFLWERVYHERKICDFRPCKCYIRPGNPHPKHYRVVQGRLKYWILRLPNSTEFRIYFRHKLYQVWQKYPEHTPQKIGEFHMLIEAQFHITKILLPAYIEGTTSHD